MEVRQILCQMLIFSVMIRSFSDLEVYKKSQELYPKVIEFSRQFSSQGVHLRNQVCRSANSIHANIAEGYGRSITEFKLYLTRALGSNNETISHINDAINSNFGNKDIGNELVKAYTVIGKQIYKLRENWK